ncbi:MAG: leucine-rich repeat domain-containing protein, partial [Bacteroides sp.]|nr:leucine-rich repeat domain-containing protein [Ruminococcus flavefaciens]MCM1555648.1 leucine-rich repeat domain-containing protein [Bacteroides sp.]
MKRLFYLLAAILAFTATSLAKSDTIRIGVEEGSYSFGNGGHLYFYLTEDVFANVEMEWVYEDGTTGKYKPEKSGQHSLSLKSGQLYIHYSETSKPYSLRITSCYDAGNNPPIDFKHCGIEVGYYTGTSSATSLGGTIKLTSLDVHGCTALSNLDCSGNPLIASLDVSNNTALINLNCSGRVWNDRSIGSLKELNVSTCPSLQVLTCSGQELTSLDVSKNTALRVLDCSFNQLTSLDVSKNTSLISLDCSSNQLTSLDASENTALSELYCTSSTLIKLDVSGCTSLSSLDCSGVLDSTHYDDRFYKGNLQDLNINGCTALTVLKCNFNQLSSLDISSCTSLTELYCAGISSAHAYGRVIYNGLLEKLEVAECKNLKTIDCSGHKLSSLNVKNLTSLRELSCAGNQLKTLNVSGLTALTKLQCTENQLTSLEAKGCTA